MNAIWGVLLVLALALGAFAVLVFGLGDATIFVSPPEAVVEGFTRQLATGRYERALPFLSEDLAARTGPDQLRALTERLKSRTGEITDVRGEPGWIQGDRAEATVALKTESAGESKLKFPLSRQEGTWSIDGLEALEAGRVR
jgi:hypothetical protein